MDTILKPVMKLLPKRKGEQEKKEKDKGDKDPPPNLHHLLYAMKNLNPKFIAVATEVCVVPWSMGSRERPEIDAFLTVMREAELAHRREKEERERHKRQHKKKEDEEESGSEHDDHKSDAHPHDGDEKHDKKDKKKKKKKVLPSYGCCLTDKGTLTFISPDGLAMLEASINRRNMHLIEVKKARHCVDAEVDGVMVTVVWSFIDNSAQTGEKAKAKFKEVAAEVLPDVEYREVFDSDSDEDDKEEEDKKSEHHDQRSDEQRDVRRPSVESAPEPGKLRSSRPLPETAKLIEVSDDEIPSPPPEYEQLQGEPDEEPFDLTPAVRRLERARQLTLSLTQRKKAAQKWLTDYEAARQAEEGGAVATANDDSVLAEADTHVSDRETVLRLALLIAVICDKRRTLNSALAARLELPEVNLF